jgi:1-phosphofructokinase family hexose kinase
VLIAGPNLTTDRTLAIEELRPGEVLRFTGAVVTPGGKGVNVARVARALRASALLVSLVPGRTGRAVGELIRDEGIELVGVPAPGEVRAAIVVLEQSGRVTVLNEPGPRVGEEEWNAYERAVRERLAGHRILVCSGSVPPGSPGEAYARLVRIARTHSVPALVDAAGETLAAALEAEPDVVTPNYVEAEGALFATRGDEADVTNEEARARATDAAARLAGKARAAIVTAGAAGAALHVEGESTWLAAPSVSVTNSVGAGDSLVGAFAAAVERGEDVRTAFRHGVAAAAASVETDLAGGIDAERARELARALAAR